jgi:hypothetical protein
VEEEVMSSMEFFFVAEEIFFTASVTKGFIAIARDIIAHLRHSM